MAIVGAKEALLELTDTIQAAGGVVVRRAGGRVEVALVHRPRYDDWSFPKGKLLPGESHLGAARREVGEETGLDVRTGVELPISRYVTSEGAPKEVRYWLMQPGVDQELRPTDEVDRAQWVAIDEAKERLTHDVDRELLGSVTEMGAPAYLIRHAKAGDRAAWPGRDRRRPLSKAGRRQAKGLLLVFQGRRIRRIMSSPAVRCLETVQPLAAERGLAVERTEELAEGAPLQAALALIETIASTPTVLCAHGDLIPAIVEHEVAAGALPGGQTGWKKGSTWILERNAGLIVRTEYVAPVDPGPPTRKRARRRRS